MDMKDVQTRVVLNKRKKGFEVGNFLYEFSLIKKELQEAIDAHNDGTNVGEELADIVLLCAGIAEMKGLDFEKELLTKLTIIENRQYVERNGILVKV